MLLLYYSPPPPPPLSLSSSAILQYIVEKFNLPDHWYPKDLKARTKVNEYLFWHHCHLRRGASGTFVNKVSVLTQP